MKTTRINESTNQRINESTNQRINESTNQRINESTARTVISLLLLAMFIVIGCNKETTSLENFFDEPVSYRFNDGMDVSWITDFQTYLRDLRDNISTSQSYTLQEIEYGIETLSNLKYSKYKLGTRTFIGNCDTIDFNPNLETPYDFLLEVVNSIENSTTEDNIAAFDLELDTVKNGVSQFIASTILYDEDYNGSALDKLDGLFMGAGEIRPDVPSSWLECYEHGYGPCNPPTWTAISEIQEMINTKMVPKFNDGYCETDDPNVDGEFIKFINIHEIPFSPSWKDLYDYYAPTGPILPKKGFKSCDCLDEVQIISIYGAVRHYLLEAIPVNYKMVFMNFGTTLDGQPGFEEDNIYNIGSKVRIAKVECWYRVNNHTGILEPEIIP